MFDQFLNSTYKNIPWVTVIDSWKKWKSVWILAITHGNEAIWLRVFDYLINDFDIKNKIVTWKIYLIAVNIKAYSKHTQDNDRLKWRFIDDNMNRIHGKKYKSNSYEFQRKKELEWIFDEIDVAIDLHCSSWVDDVIWITDQKYINKAHKLLDVENIVADDLANSWALIGYLTKNNKESYGVECGTKKSPKTLISWENNSLRILHDNWLLSSNYTKVLKKQWTYKILHEILPSDETFTYTTNYKEFEKIWFDEAYAKDKNKIYRNNFGKDVYIWFLPNKPIVWYGNSWFLLEKINFIH